MVRNNPKATIKATARPSTGGKRGFSPAKLRPFAPADAARAGALFSSSNPAAFDRFDWLVLLTFVCSPLIVLGPVLFGIPVLKINAAGLCFFGTYTLLLPQRICMRFHPQQPVGFSTAFLTPPSDAMLAALRDLLQGWALFSIGLGGAAWLLDGQSDGATRRAATGLFALVGAASVAWDVKLARSLHWGGGRFFALNISVNAWLVVGNCWALAVG